MFPLEQDLRDGLRLSMDVPGQWTKVKDHVLYGHHMTFHGECEGVKYTGYIDRVFEEPWVHVVLTEIEGKPV